MQTGLDSNVYHGTGAELDIGRFFFGQSRIHTFSDTFGVGVHFAQSGLESE